MTRLKFDRLAVDSNAAIDWLRPERPQPPFDRAARLVLPLFVLAELKFGFERARLPGREKERLASFISRCELLLPDVRTSDYYVTVRASTVSGTIPRSEANRQGYLNDLWIAALCLQHDLPLLTNDRDFDRIEGVRVIHW